MFPDEQNIWNINKKLNINIIINIRLNNNPSVRIGWGFTFLCFCFSFFDDIKSILFHFCLFILAN